MKFQQIRGATAIVTYGGKTFLLDPFFAEKASTPSIPSPYNTSLNPLVALPVSVEELVSVDAVIVTHMHHFDHFDEAARDAIPKDKPIFTQNEGEAEDMRKLGFKNVTSLRASGVSSGEITLFRTDAAHGQGEAAAKNYKAIGLPAEASGVVFKHPNEKTLYIAGDTVWYEGVKDAIDRYEPGVIVLNAALAAFFDETPILMGTEGLYEVTRVAPTAAIIASHLDAVNHARLGRKEMRQFVDEKKLVARVYIPEDGKTLSF
ncbi:MAG: MBL fold metallo-hydrolase [Desulfopila sp.]